MSRGPLRRVLAVAANTHRETIRERVLYNLVLFAVLLTFCGLLIGQITVQDEERIIKDIGLAAMDVFGSLIAVFIGVGLVSKEIERRSLFPLLAKPLTRSEFLLGKFAGLGFTLVVNIFVMTLGLYLTLIATGKRADGLLLKAIVPIYLGLLLTVAIAVLFSTVTSSSSLAAMCTVAVVVAGRFSDVIRNMRDVAPDVPTWLTQTIYYALPNFRNFDFKERAVYGDPIPVDDLLAVALYAGMYVAVLLGIALTAFRRREFQ